MAGSKSTEQATLVVSGAKSEQTYEIKVDVCIRMGTRTRVLVGGRWLLVDTADLRWST